MSEPGSLAGSGCRRSRASSGGVKAARILGADVYCPTLTTQKQQHLHFDSKIQWPLVND